MSKNEKCPTGKHTDRLVRGGKRVKCTTCGDSFPCSVECIHLDCALERQEPGAIIHDELGFDVSDASPEVSSDVPF